jgi:hypothetical protein
MEPDGTEAGSSAVRLNIDELVRTMNAGMQRTNVRHFQFINMLLQKLKRPGCMRPGWIAKQ